MERPDADALLARFRDTLGAAATPEAVDDVRRAWAGKASPFKEALKALKDLPADERPAFAAGFNQAMAVAGAEIDARKATVEAAAVAARLDAEWSDLTMPGTAPRRGARHPLTVVEARCMAVLRQLGFTVVDGPEVDTAYYNFDALNIPKHHPARDMQDTFWVAGSGDPHGDRDVRLLLRSHTTTVQARVLESKPPLPIRVASMGRVYRNEAVDATHLAMFHQFEGIWIDRGLTFAHLKGVLSFVAKSLYGDHRVRFKPKFYPYTEPSVGVDLACTVCETAGCDACHGAGWVTILGAGMVHPNVFREFGYDPAEVSGIAFGFGTGRMAAQWAGVHKIRSLYETDLRVHAALRGAR